MEQANASPLRVLLLHSVADIPALIGPIPDAEREKWVNKRYMPNGPKIPKLLEKDAGASEKASKHGVLK